MINFIDEKKLVDKFVKNKKLINNNTYTYLVAYTKYLKNEKGMSKAKIRDELDRMMETHYDGFCMADFDTMLQKIANKYSKKENCEYKKPREITITKDELEFIKSTDDINTEYLLFTLLVLAKVNDVDSEDLMVVFDESDLFKISKYKYKTKSKPRIEQRNIKLNDLEQQEYISFGNIFNSQTIKLKYGDKDDCGDGIKLIVTDNNIEDIVYYYNRWKGDKKIVNCTECGKLVVQNGKKPTLYCKECAENIDNKGRNNRKR